MKTLKIALPVAVLAAGFLVCSTASYGKMEYAKKEGKNLNDTGKCYAKNEHKDLAKCPVPAEKK